MSRLLILSDDYPYDQTSGRHLRVFSLCRELIRNHDCYFVAMSSTDTTPDRPQDLPFRDIVRLREQDKQSRSWKRHFRISNARYIERSTPAYFRETVSEISRLAGMWAIDLLINFAPPLAEIGAAIDRPKISDIPDCDTLTIERIMAHRGRDMTAKDRLLMRIHRQRQLMRERSLLNSYNLTTTIAEPDRQKLLELSGVNDNRVICIPNGVNEALILDGEVPGRRTRSVVFWGNLGFAPNWTAVIHFYRDIFLPHLADEGVEWYIVGKGATDRLKAIAGHPLIHFAGFQDDLPAFVADKGVMINPMTEGSGLKNKVIEAFAMCIPVVSTPLGIEAIGGRDGEHYLVGETPEDFSRKVLMLLADENRARSIAAAASRLVTESYTWPVAGREFENALAVLRD